MSNVKLTIEGTMDIVSLPTDGENTDFYFSPKM
jgi:hypothetical protein